MGIVNTKGINTQQNATISSPLLDGMLSNEMNYKTAEESRTINLEGIKATVDRIHIDGLRRTKNDIIEDAVKDLFRATDFQDVLIRIHHVRNKLDSLGCFRNISVFIDTSKGPKSHPDGLEITFQVNELKRLIAGVSTHIGNNEGSLVFGLKAPNVFGRGEKVQFEYSHGSHRTNNLDLAYVKPLRGSLNPVLSTFLYKHTTEWLSSGYEENDVGVGVDLGFNSFSLLKHKIQWIGALREISILGRGSAFEIREEAGPNMKSALKHLLSMDTRNDAIFPTCGSLFMLNTEYAGFGGNIGFLKNDVYLQNNFAITEDHIFQTTFNAGYIKSNHDADMKITLSDMFFLGGPLNIRGFNSRGIGPHVDGDSLGARWFWCGGMHLFTPLPLKPGKGGFGDNFKTHFFVTWGNIGNSLSDRKPVTEQLLDNVRLSFGIGLAMRLGQVARIEINYCIPHWSDDKDLTRPGLQFGIGFRFV